MQYADQSLYDIVVVGAGPAGISLAAEAMTKGIKAEKVLILEKAQEHSWSIRKFYPDDKLVTANYKGIDAGCKGVLCLMDSTKDEALGYLDKVIEDFKLDVRYQQEVFEIKKLNSGYYQVYSSQDTYVSKVVAIAIGVLTKPNKPSYSIPIELKNSVHFDVTSTPMKNKKILVVGGGDSASEYAQYLVQQGNQVSFSYRRAELSRMNAINKKVLLDLSEQKRVELLLSSDIDKLEADANRPKVFYKDNNPQVYDHIVYALGGSSPNNFLKTIGIKVSTEGPQLNENFESSEEGIFLVGDISAGKTGGSINLAFNSAHDAVKEFCKSYLDCTYSS